MVYALRKLFATFGVPTELTSDGGPAFTAKSTEEFLHRWGVRHRLSSSYLPSSNGRAELAVKATKRLLMNNIDGNGDLDNDLRALLMKRNTPDPGCKLSPAEVLFGHPLRDSLPYIRKDVDMFDNTQITDRWRHAWSLKEEALKARYIKSMERLNEHSRCVPPLKVGDNVFVQNQKGHYPNKWDSSGVIVEVKDFDEYLIKLTGSGRITLRNQRLIRKFEPHTLYNTGTCKLPIPSVPLSQVHPEPSPNASSSPFFPPTAPVVTTKQPESPDPESERHNQSPHPEFSPNSDDMLNETVPNSPIPRRSSRARSATRFYDPESGTYVKQNP